MRDFESEIIFWDMDLEGSIRLLQEKRKCFLFTDENLLELYGNFSLPYYAMPAGEDHKDAETLFALLNAMARAHILRSDLLICMGGGVVTDVGGLAASLYMRGISHVLLPTSLLAQVDACIGGKTGIDFRGQKNLLGTFYFPEKIVIFDRFTDTLPRREIVCGLGEVIKYAVLDKDFFEFVFSRRAQLFDPAFLREIIPRCIAIKRAIVRRDPFEHGERRCLNLGHTTGHVLEMSGYGLSHGECVLYGLVLESAAFSDKAFSKQIKMLAESACGALTPLSLSKEQLRCALLDKKNHTNGEVLLPFEKTAGKYCEIELSFDDYAEKIMKEMNAL